MEAIEKYEDTLCVFSARPRPSRCPVLAVIAGYQVERGRGGLCVSALNPKPKVLCTNSAPCG